MHACPQDFGKLSDCINGSRQACLLFWYPYLATGPGFYMIRKSKLNNSMLVFIHCSLLLTAFDALLLAFDHKFNAVFFFLLLSID